MELLILLVAKKGQLVSREEIIERLWGKDVFVDSEHGINTAIRKIKQVLNDDREQPRFIETIVGKGYRFVSAIEVVPARTASEFVLKRVFSFLLPQQLGTTETGTQILSAKC